MTLAVPTTKWKGSCATACTCVFGSGRTANLAATAMMGLTVISMPYAVIGIQP